MAELHSEGSESAACGAGLFFKKDTIVVIDNNNFCDKQMDRATLLPTRPRGPSR